jgi:hypothetical protein
VTVKKPRGSHVAYSANAPALSKAYLRDCYTKGRLVTFSLFTYHPRLFSHQTSAFDSIDSLSSSGYHTTSDSVLYPKKGSRYLDISKTLNAVMSELQYSDRFGPGANCTLEVRRTLRSIRSLLEVLLIHERSCAQPKKVFIVMDRPFLKTPSLPRYFLRPPLFIESSREDGRLHG